MLKSYTDVEHFLRNTTIGIVYIFNLDITETLLSEWRKLVPQCKFVCFTTTMPSHTVVFNSVILYELQNCTSRKILPKHNTHPKNYNIQINMHINIFYCHQFYLIDSFEQKQYLDKHLKIRESLCDVTHDGNKQCIYILKGTQRFFSNYQKKYPKLRLVVPERLYKKWMHVFLENRKLRVTILLAKYTIKTLPVYAIAPNRILPQKPVCHKKMGPWSTI